MRVLFATSEAYPLIKTGGLADVSGALPKTINNLAEFDSAFANVEVKILIPGYSAVLEKLKNITPIAKIEALGQTCTLLMGKMPDSDTEVIAIQNTPLYERKGGPLQ